MSEREQKLTEPETAIPASLKPATAEAANAIKPLKAKKTKKKKSWKRELVEWIITILAAVVIAFVIRSFVGELVRVDGNSMYPTLYHNEYMVVDKLAYGSMNVPFVGNFPVGGDPQRFDVVICRYPDTCKDPNTYRVKRIIGLPGDVISYDANGNLCVNGVSYEETYLLNHRNYSYVCERIETRTDAAGNEMTGRAVYKQSYTVPEGKYFVLGDNRSASSDSHTAIVGDLDRDMIVGRVRYIIKPGKGVNRRAIPNGLEDTLVREPHPELLKKEGN